MLFAPVQDYAAPGEVPPQLPEIELAITDYLMPGENGLQLAETLQREMPSCKLLMLTAYASNAIKVEQHASRTKLPLKLLSKPCRPEILLREAHDLLQTA